MISESCIARSHIWHCIARTTLAHGLSPIPISKDLWPFSSSANWIPRMPQKNKTMQDEATLKKALRDIDRLVVSCILTVTAIILSFSHFCRFWVLVTLGVPTQLWDQLFQRASFNDSLLEIALDEIGLDEMAHIISNGGVRTPVSAIVVNILWNLGLGLGIVGSLFGILVRLWIDYEFRKCNICNKRCVVFGPLSGTVLNHQKLPAIISVIKAILRAAIIFYLVGLIVLQTLETTFASIVTGTIGVVLVVLALIYSPRCSYRPVSRDEYEAKSSSYISHDSRITVAQEDADPPPPLDTLVRPCSVHGWMCNAASVCQERDIFDRCAWLCTHDWARPDLANLVLYALDHQDSTSFFMSIPEESAKQMVSFVQNLLDIQKEQAYSPCDRALRHHLFKLLKTFAEANRILPSQLHLEGVECTDYDRQNAINTIGGFSDIHYGKYRGKPVALKKLRVMGLDRQANNFLLALLKEALKWRQFSHKNILPFLGLDMSTFRNNACMISPWMDNGDIRRCKDRLKNDDLDVPIVRWLQEIAEGLQYLHAQDFAHGDLRGPNILIDGALHVQLADFGLAHCAFSALGNSPPYPSANPYWTAPELLTGVLHRPNTASDIYSFAYVCIEIHTEYPPPQDNRYIMYSRVMNGYRPERPTKDTDEHMEDALWELVQACWHEHPGSRPLADDLVQRLHALDNPATYSCGNQPCL